jgi:hypothetical protein
MRTATYRGDRRHDNSRTVRRFRYAPAPELATPQFAYIGNGNYAAVIEGANHGFILKAFTPSQCWRIFYIAPDGGQIELKLTFAFDMPAVAMWHLLGHAAYSLTLNDDRAEDETN